MEIRFREQMERRLGLVLLSTNRRMGHPREVYRDSIGETTWDIAP
jgi:hypothetical protein